MPSDPSNAPSSTSSSRAFPTYAIVIAAILVGILLVVLFLPSEPDAPPQPLQPVQVTSEVDSPANADESAASTSETELEQNNDPANVNANVNANVDNNGVIEDDFAVMAPLPEVSVDDVEVTEDAFVEPVIVEEAPEPILLTDNAVSAAIISIAKMPMLTEFLVNDGILDRVVANTNNLAAGKLAPNLSALTPPEDDFSVYKQAGIIYINPNSFNRYDNYVEAFTAIEPRAFNALYDQYRDTLDQRIAEVRGLNNAEGAFNRVALEAINHLLDTPIPNLPIAVQSDSAMYTFVNPNIEALSDSQKQFIRIGPNNMRRVKQHLRELREALESR